MASTQSIEWCTQDLLQGGRHAYLQDAGSFAHAVCGEVGDAHGLREALPGTLPQPLHKGVITPAVGDKARPVLHVEPRFLDSQPIQACPVDQPASHERSTSHQEDPHATHINVPQPLQLCRLSERCAEPCT